MERPPPPQPRGGRGKKKPRGGSGSNPVATGANEAGTGAAGGRGGGGKRRGGGSNQGRGKGLVCGLGCGGALSLASGFFHLLSSRIRELHCNANNTALARLHASSACSVLRCEPATIAGWLVGWLAAAYTSALLVHR